MRPGSTPAEVARLFDAMAADYERLEPWYEHLYAVLDLILGAALAPDGRRPGRALDAGCGTGFQARRLAALGYTVHGADRAGALLALARRRLPASPLAQADLEALPYRAASFDAVTCCGSTLSFVPDPARALGELARVLRPGGRLLLECEHRWSADLFWALGSSLCGDPLGYGQRPGEAWRCLTRRPAEGVWAAYPGYGRLHLFTGRELRRLLRAAGLAPVRAWGIHALTMLVPSTVLHRERLGPLTAALYRALRRLDRALAGSWPARHGAASLVVLARRDAAGGLQ